MYAGWMTVSGMVLAGGMWLAWEGINAREASVAFARPRVLACVGVLLTGAAIALAVMGYVALHAGLGHAALVAFIAFPAAAALGAGGIALIQAAAHLRRDLAKARAARRRA